MQTENKIEKIIYHDAWFDMMTMSSGGKIVYELYPDGRIRVERFTADGCCVEKTASKMAETGDFTDLSLRLGRYLENESICTDDCKNCPDVEVTREDGSVEKYSCCERNFRLGDMVWEYIQSYAMTSDAYI